MTTTTVHTPACLKQAQERERTIQEWEARYPHYCRPCAARGQFFYSYDPSPTRVSLASGTLVDIDPCVECTEKGICPRCGTLAWVVDEDGWMDDDTQTPCPSCGWNWGKQQDDGRPPDYECYCWEEAYVREERRRYLELLAEDLPF